MNIQQLWVLVGTADVVGLCVLGVLAFCYFGCFFIMVYKYFMIRAIRKQMELFAECVLLPSPQQVLAGLRGYTAANVMIRQWFVALDTLTSHYTSTGHKAASVQHVLIEQDLAELSLAIDAAASEQVHDLEEGMFLLSASAAVAPLLGLLGTVWGLIAAFMSIGSERSSDLSVVAPGLAEALLATLAGLLVAIPALASYHYFAHRIRVLEFQFGCLAEEFLNAVKVLYVVPHNSEKKATACDPVFSGDDACGKELS